MVFLKLALLVLGVIGIGYAIYEFNIMSRYKLIYNLGVDSLKEGNLGVAEKSFRKVLAINPEMAENIYNLGLTYFYMHKFDLALNYFFKTLEQSPRDADAYYNIGIIYYIKNNKKETLQHFRKALDLMDSKDEQTLFSMAMVYTEMQDYDMAIRTVSRLIELAPSNIDYRMTLADIYEKLIADTGNIQSIDFAMKTYLEILEIDDRHEGANTKLANCYAQMGDIENCKEYCQKILQGNTKSSEALYLLGIISFSAQELQNAVNYFEQAIEAKPSLKQAYINAAYAYVRLEDYVKTIEHFENYKSKSSAADITPDMEEFFGMYKELAQEKLATPKK